MGKGWNRAALTPPPPLTTCSSCLATSLSHKVQWTSYLWFHCGYLRCYSRDKHKHKRTSNGEQQNPNTELVEVESCPFTETRRKTYTAELSSDKRLLVPVTSIIGTAQWLATFNQPVVVTQLTWGSVWTVSIFKGRDGKQSRLVFPK